MPELIAFYIDALDSNHIDPDVTPNIHRWKENRAVSNLSSLFAFKGISAAMYGGVSPKTSGVWMDFKVKETPHKKLGDSLLSVASRFPSGLPRKGAVVAYERLVRRSRVTPHIVPANLRPYFQAHPPEPMTGKQPLGEIPTIFDRFRANDISYRTVGLAGGPQDRITKKIRTADEYEESVILMKSTLLDHVGHKYGPGSEEHKEALRETDNLVGELADKPGDFELFLFSDHGMQSVNETIDLRSLLVCEAGLQEERDFVAFFNSTCLLVRWLSEHARERALEKIENNNAASFLADDTLEELNIGTTKQDFADDVIATKPGVAVSPDFYRQTPPRGMHGFTHNPTGGPVAIAPGKQLADEGELWDIAPTILDLLSLEWPEEWDGSTLL